MLFLLTSYQGMKAFPGIVFAHQDLSAALQKAYNNQISRKKRIVAEFLIQ